MQNEAERDKEMRNMNEIVRVIEVEWKRLTGLMWAPEGEREKNQEEPIFEERRDEKVWEPSRDSRSSAINMEMDRHKEIHCRRAKWKRINQEKILKASTARRLPRSGF